MPDAPAAALPAVVKAETTAQVAAAMTTRPRCVPRSAHDRDLIVASRSVRSIPVLARGTTPEPSLARMPDVGIVRPTPHSKLSAGHSGLKWHLPRTMTCRYSQARGGFCSQKDGGCDRLPAAWNDRGS